MAAINSVGNSLTGSTGTGAFVGATAPALLLPSANNFIGGYATTATAAGTTTLVAGSAYQQFFTGAAVQNVNMPVTSTITIGQSWLIVNNSSQIVTVRSSGGNNILAMPAGTNTIVTCIAQAGTTASDWNAEGVSGVAGVDSITGTANQVIASAATGPVTLSLPQDIATSSTPLFAGVSAASLNDAAAELVMSLVKNGPGAAVNYWQVGSSQATTNISLQAAGSDTNISMQFGAKGAGTFAWFSTGSTAVFSFNTGTASQHVTNFDFANTAQNRTITWPDASGTVALSGASQAVTFASINFGGTALANYLEGTFTPTIASTGGGAPTYTLQQGQYTRIGNRVLFNIFVILATTGTLAAGSVTIAGLPIAAAANCSCAVFAQNLAAGVVTQVMASTANASTSIGMSQFAAGGAGDINATSLTNTSQFEISGNYIV